MHRRADLRIELPQKMILADEELLRQLVQRQGLAVVLVDVVQHRVHDLVTRAGGAGVAALGCGTVQADQKLHQRTLGQKVAAVRLVRL